MRKEVMTETIIYQSKDSELKEQDALVRAFMACFVNRTDWYAVQLKDGSYVAMHKPLTSKLIVRHLKGQVTIGIYALNTESQAKWICFDADTDEQGGQLHSLSQRLHGAAVPSYIEDSRRGCHLWLFFSEQLPGRTARAFARALLGAAEPMEIYPKQDVLDGGPGSLVRLPLGVHRLSLTRHPIRLGGTMPTQDQRDQLGLFVRPCTVPTAFVATTLADAVAARPLLPSAPTVAPRREATGASTIERIKAAFDIAEFVGEYVQINRAGKGLCPFHDDARASFSVNKERQFWNCFAGCGGGDVIVFWEKLRGIDRRTAIRELAEMLERRGTQGESDTNTQVLDSAAHLVGGGRK